MSQTEPTPQSSQIPVSALLLGVAGLIPFFGLAIWQGVTGDELLSERLMMGFVFYAASILSFLGGVGWGLAMSESDPVQRGLAFGVSTVPSLIAWAAAFINVQNLGFALTILGAAFLLQAAWDWHLTQLGRAPGWFAKLRIGLTIAVICAIALAWSLQPQLSGVGGVI
ncbi:MAG: hypothetical protein JWO64_2186 [Hyphomicrobiales bacterium]|jgi:hypothetical protein|nr:hypothetical protein [Hyphomicrobiales bacterium]